MTDWLPPSQVAQMEKWKVNKHLISVGEYRDVGKTTHVDEAHNLERREHGCILPSKDHPGLLHTSIQRSCYELQRVVEESSGV